jgi:hypothetical protein
MQRAILAALDRGPMGWWDIYHHATGSHAVQPPWDHGLTTAENRARMVTAENYRHSLRRALRRLVAAGRLATADGYLYRIVELLAR